jgi:DNA-binding transcriptional regulator YdaS (Cro superfamily)
MWGMHLREYLVQPGSLSVAELRQRMNELGADIGHDAQLRQWASEPKPGTPARRPDAANCRYLEIATGGKVTRQSMRPADYAAIWPELAGPSKKASRRTAAA